MTFKMSREELKKFREMGEGVDPLTLGYLLFKLVGKERVASLISMGLESGGMATFGVEKYVEPPKVDFMSDPDMGLFKYMDYPLCTGGGVWLFCRHAETKEEYGPFLLNERKCALGLGRMFLQEPHQYANVLDDAGADFFTGDTFLQCALLGKTIYG